MKNLTEILGVASDKGHVPVAGITCDSRAVRPGFIFAALPGTRVNGQAFIADAVSLGAAAILISNDYAGPLHDAVPFIRVANVRRSYAEMVARFFGGQPKHIVAVTGTNGKTSVADFVRQLWSLSGLSAASIGTLGVRSDVYNAPGGLTTPDPQDIHAHLTRLVDADVDHAVIEASSHGLDQHRLDGVTFDAAGFLNLSRDHMDYHQNDSSYFYAKARLFGDLMTPDKLAVVNIDGDWGRKIHDLVWGRGLKTLTVGWDADADLSMRSLDATAAGMSLTVGWQGRDYDLSLPLIGKFQAENMLMALGLASSTGLAMADLLMLLPKIKGVPGRMEYLGRSAKGGYIYVDYAHTPDGLQTVLSAAKAHSPAALKVVFGCGGDRDAGKRPMMGAIAADLADQVYVTDDNPRSEEAATIRSEIMAACPQAREIGDRSTAIEEAIAHLNDGEMLIVAGKGHEEGQIVGDQILPFSDIGRIREILGTGEADYA